MKTIFNLILVISSFFIIYICYHQNMEGFNKSSQVHKQNTNQPINSDLIQYVYHQSEDADFNLRFFLTHALDEKADFVFIINGHSSLVGEIPQRPNIKVVIRQNTCFDIGAHGDVLHQLPRWKLFQNNFNECFRQRSVSSQMG